MNARQKAKYYKKKYEELSNRQSNNSFIIHANKYTPSFPSFPLEPSQVSYHIGNCYVSKPYFSDIDSSSSAEETFKPCQTMEEKK